MSVRLVDVNGQTVQTLPFTTSDFGSFQRLPGAAHGLAQRRNEPANRPRQPQLCGGGLQAAHLSGQLDSVPGRPQLGQPLTISGRARAYAGQATDGATVSYRVTRRELWPLFDYGYGGRGIYPPGGNRGSQEIAHGTTTTDAEGRFTLTFTPPLVPKAPGGRRGWEPGYLFEITADVTDAAGETRTGTRSGAHRPQPAQPAPRRPRCGRQSHSCPPSRC